MKLNIPSLSGDDRGVSPVIGVILMVAITVILAAVIGTFVLGLGDQLGDSVNAGVSVDQDATNVTVTLVNKGNADSVEVRGEDSKTMTEVGESVSVAHGNENVQVIASKEDGTEAVIRTIQVNEAE